MDGNGAALHGHAGGRVISSSDLLCSCACHGAYQGACSVEGGCGSVGCDYVWGPSAEDLERRCALGQQCRYREPVRDPNGRATGAWLPCRITVERGLCKACALNVVDALVNLPGDIVELTTLLGRWGASAETFVSGTPELSTPINLTIDALRTRIDSELQEWAEPVAEALGVDWDTVAMSRTRMAVRSQRAADLLRNAVDTLLALGPQEHPAWEFGEPVWAPEFLPEYVQDTVIRDGVDGAIALFDLHRLAKSTAGRTEYVERVALPCTRCGLRALVRHNGDDFVICENCRWPTPWEHIPFLCRVLIDCERALVEERQRQGAA